MTFLEIQDDVMQSLNLTSDEARTRVKRAINKKLREVQSSIRLELTRRTVVSGQTTSGSSSITVSGAKVLAVYDKDTLKRVLEQVTLYDLRRIDAPQDVTGSPYLWAEALRGPETSVLELYPQPTAAAWLFFDVLDNATELTDDGDEPGFPADFHDLLVDGARYEELRKMEKMLPYAQEAMQRFKERIADLRYFIAKSAWKRTRQTDQFGDFGLSARVWPYQNIGV